MKKLLFYFAVTAMFASTASAQEQNSLSSEHYVEVRGNASKSVEPDRISVYVSLSEADTKGKVSMTQLEAAFATALEKSGVDIKSDVVMNGQSSEADKRKGSFLFKNYIVTLKSIKVVNDLFSELDINNIKTASISRAWLSNQKDVLDSLKVEAVKDAKRTADLLAEGLGQSTSRAFQIIDNNYAPSYDEGGFYRVKAMMPNSDALESSPLEDVSFKKITLNQNITVRFILHWK